MTEEKKGMLAASLAYGIFGLSYLFSKMALNVTTPMILLCVRFTITFLALNLLAVTRVIRIDLKGKNLIGPICLGLLQPVFYFIFENYGLSYTTTSFTGMISSVSPVFTAALGALILRERPNRKQWICILVSILGVLMVSLRSGGGENTWLGCFCLVVAYLSGAGFALLSRRMSKQFSPFELTYIMFTVGFVFFLGGAFVQHGGETLPMIQTAMGDSSFIVAVLFLSLASSVCAYMLSNYALAHLPVARMTIFNNVSTIVSVLAGVLVMGDPFTLTSGVAFVLILAGVWGVNRFADRADAA